MYSDLIEKIALNNAKIEMIIAKEICFELFCLKVKSPKKEKTPRKEKEATDR